MDNLKSYIANYLKLEEALTNRNKTIKEIRSKKNDMENLIIKLIEENNLKNTKINLNHCYIKYNINEIIHPLNIEFLKLCLIKYFNGDEKKSVPIIEFIQRERNINKKQTISLKKFKNKSKKKKLLKS
jgi:hypothetical protein